MSGVDDVAFAAPTTPEAPPGRSDPARGWDRYDAAVLAVATVATFFVHPVQLMLRHPFWLDEAWVAVLTRAPIAKLPRLTSSAPLGFIGLLKLVPGSGLQRGRLVVLGFSILTVVAAYVLTRSLGWKRRATARIAASVAALVVMLAPVSLMRNDLKQYTCDAFCAVVILAMADRAERHPTIRSLVWLAVAAVLTSPFSSTALFVSVAAFAGLLAAALLAIARRRAIEVLVAGVATGGAARGVLRGRGRAEPERQAARILVEPVPQRIAAGHVAGVVEPARRVSHRSSRCRRSCSSRCSCSASWCSCACDAHAIAIAIPLLWVEMALMGRLRRYPFLDLRTSHFLLVVSLLVVALGAVGVVGAVSRLPVVVAPPDRLGRSDRLDRGGGSGRGHGRVSSRTASPATSASCTSPSRTCGPRRTPSRRRCTRDDVVLVSESAAFGFAYYWPHGHVRFHSDGSGQGFGVTVAGLDAVYLPTRTYKAELAGLLVGLDRLRRAGPGAALYIVRTHLSPAEVARWHQGLDALHLAPEVEPVGSETLLIVRAPAGGAS